MNRNPFPGMNPYLEAVWTTVHTSLLTYARDQIQRNLPDGLFAITEQGLRVDAQNGVERIIRPDVQIAEDWDRAPATAVAVLDIPIVKNRIIAYVEPEVERWIEIIDQAGNLITALEFLSPSNKDNGLAASRNKRRTLAEGQVNYVEIDLLREGQRVSVPRQVCREHPAPYYAVIVRRLELTTREIIPISMQEPLPSVPIPLRQQDADILLDLQALLDEIFEKARFPWIKYDERPEGPLTVVEAQWIDSHLRAAGLRP